MFDLIAEELRRLNFVQYEISNFSIPGFESRHNKLYWEDEPYLGLGLSAHSYSKHSRWGTRFWNINSIGDYQNQIASSKGKSFSAPDEHLPEAQFEELEKHQALTDFCHTSTRLMRGLNLDTLEAKFSTDTKQIVQTILSSLRDKKLVGFSDNHWSLTPEGIVLSNQVFRELTFLKEDL